MCCDSVSSQSFPEALEVQTVDLMCDASALRLHEQRKAVLTSGYLVEVYEYLHKLGSD